MSAPPPTEFGKRKPATPEPLASPPVKRSRHVALLMCGTMAVGGIAYGLTPRQNCEPASPGMAAPSTPQTATNCTRSSSSGGHGGNGSWSRSNFFSGDSSSGHASPGGQAASGETARGGFGSFARSFAAHFSGG